MRNEVRFVGERVRKDSKKRAKIVNLVKSLEFDLVGDNGDLPEVSVVKVGGIREFGVYFLCCESGEVNAFLYGGGCCLGNDGRGKYVLYRQDEGFRKARYKFYFGNLEELVYFES